MVMARRARDTGLSLESGDVGRETVRRIVAELGLPLIGPELPDYPERIAKAAARWLNHG